MASPMSVGGGQMGGYSGNGNNQPMSQANDFQDAGVQVRSMGLKVHYTFDKDGKVNCLARYPHTIQAQTLPIDETNTIGVLDLRICIQAVIECSPELGSQDGDYTIYALDYSEPDTPLVGQGMLSWAIESLGGDMGNREPKMVTGRVTKNLLGVFGGGNRETLEVKLKLASVAKVQRPEGSRGMDTQQSRPVDATTPSAMTPTGASEWNSFMRNNPQIGQPAQHQRGASPALSHASQGPPMLQHRDSFGQTSQSMPGQDPQRVAPVPVDPNAAPAVGPSSRPSSRTSNRAPRKKQPTGRPRGRPRKRPLEGNTSGYEDGTEGEDGPANPAKKRVTTTKVDKTKSNPFGAEPESLRVAASTSGSLRNFRPVGMSQEIIGAGSHLQDIPRAPTPVPNGSTLGMPGRPSNMSKMRRGSAMSQELVAPSQPTQYADARLASFQEDGRSPESTAPTPAYSEDSHADIGSSPPVARNTPFIRSSPPPSSPILPPMPEASMAQAQLIQMPQDLSFMNTDMDELFADEALQNALREAVPNYAPSRHQIEAKTDSSGIPMLVFEMQDGPDGQNMVHIRNYNTPQPTSTPAGPPENPYFRNYNTPHPTSGPAGPTDNMSLPPLPPPPHPQQASKQEPARPKARRPAAKKNRTTSPALAPTPPPTTDAMEKSNSPMAPPCVPQEVSESVDSRMDLDSQSAQAMASAKEPVHQDLPAELPEQALPVPESQSECPAPVAREPELPKSEVSAPPPKPKRVRIRKKPAPLNRSQSASATMLPTAAASEPAGPSSLSQTTTAAAASSSAKVPPALQRSASTGPFTRPVSSGGREDSESQLLPSLAAAPEMSANERAETPVPFSDSAVVTARSPGLYLPKPLPPAPSSPGESKAKKNNVKKNPIRERLEAAIMKGEMPPFCNNCGAIETPTWRKIWVQDFEGAPEIIDQKDLSEKPGKVTAVEILSRDADEHPSAYRLTKKTIGPDDDTTLWRELLLCNPCGIWLAKSKVHRPQNRWEKDTARQGQERRKRSSTTGSNSRPKKSKLKGDAQTNPTSEAYLPTDAMGSVEPSSPVLADSSSQQFGTGRPGSQQSEGADTRASSAGRDQSVDAVRRDSNASDGSQGKGTVKSPIDVEFDAALGSTKRLLFPSPRKDGSPMALGELSVNIVQTANVHRQKESVPEKENMGGAADEEDNDDLEDLFRSPAVARPCTPPPKSKAPTLAGAFKTPTRATPSHRPITRSVTRSIRSAKTLKSPIRFLLESPSQSARSKTESARRRRSPRNHDSAFNPDDLSHEDHDNSLEDMMDQSQFYFDGDESASPISREIMQLLERQDCPSAAAEDDSDVNKMTMEEARAQGWFDMFKSPGPASSPKRPAWVDSWYTGSMENWEQWMKDNGPDATNFHE